MIAILDAAYGWQCAKVVIVPKVPLVTNFLKEVVRWPSKWRLLWATRCPEAANSVARGVWHKKGNDEWGGYQDLTTEQLKELRDVIGLKHGLARGGLRKKFVEQLRRDHPDLEVPAGPLRINNYMRAGGRASKEGSLDPILRFGRQPGTSCWDGKLVLLDEAHNLVKPPKEKRFEEPLKNLRRGLFEMRGGVLLSLTATATKPLLEVVKGEHQRGQCSEGFLSCYMKQNEHYANITFNSGCESVGEPGQHAQVVRSHLYGRSLHRYLFKDYVEQKPDGNLAVYSAAWAPPQTIGKMGIRLGSACSDAPKLLKVVQMIQAEPLKTLVLVSKSTAYLTMLKLLREAFGRRAVDMKQHDHFNKDVFGHKHLVMVADSLTCGEGVSFLSVRRVHIVDTPPLPETFTQLLGRAHRHGSHMSLPVDQRELQCFLHVADLPTWLKDEPCGEFSRFLSACLLPRTLPTLSKIEEHDFDLEDEVSQWEAALASRGCHTYEKFMTLDGEEREEGAIRSVRHLRKKEWRNMTVDERNLQSLNRALGENGPEMQQLMALAIDRVFLQ